MDVGINDLLGSGADSLTILFSSSVGVGISWMSYSASHFCAIHFTVEMCLSFLAGSMMGEHIKAAQAALLVFLKSLPPGCYFNIVGFGSTFALMFAE